MKPTRTSIATLLLLVFISLIQTACGQKQTAQPVKTKTVLKKKAITASTEGWKTYTNTKYGFAFQYPSGWAKVGTDAEAVNRTGQITAVETNFKDEQAQTTLTVICHLAPAGATIYEYAAASKDAKQIKLAGNNAVESTSVISTNGKGEKLSLALRVVVVHCFDKKHNNDIEFQFKTPVSADKEAAKFKTVLSTLKTN